MLCQIRVSLNPAYHVATESPEQTTTVNNVTSAFVSSAVSTSTEKLGRLLVLNVEPNWTNVCRLGNSHTTHS